MGEDGRLGAEELDELLGPATDSLGSTVRPEEGPSRASHPDHRTSPERAPELLGHGEDRPTIGDRTAGFARRHRRFTAVIAVAALVGTAGVVLWSASRPPRPATAAVGATASYRPSLADMTGVNVSNGIVTSTLYLQVPAGVPVPTAVSLTGQGLGGSVLTQDGSDLTVESPLDCSTIGNLSAPATPTVLHVRHLDAAGREVAADLPLSVNPGAAGIPAADAVAALRRTCVGQLADSLVLLEVRAAATKSGEILTLGLRNPTQHELLLLGAQTDLATSDASIGYPFPTPAAKNESQQAQGTLLPAGAITSIAFPVVRTNCADVATGSEASAGLAAGEGRRSGDFALWVSPPGPQSYPRDDSWTALTLTAPQRTAVTDALAAPCRGAPQLSYRISEIKAGDPGTGTVTFQVLADAATGRLSISGDGALGSLLAVAVTPRASANGRLEVSVQLSYAYCATGFNQMLPSPPVLSLDVRDGRATFPYQLTVGNRTVLDAFGRACGQQPDLALARSAGWES